MGEKDVKGVPLPIWAQKDLHCPGLALDEERGCSADSLHDSFLYLEDRSELVTPGSQEAEREHLNTAPLGLPLACLTVGR